jgi:hypothetical protein
MTRNIPAIRPRGTGAFYINAYARGASVITKELGSLGSVLRGPRIARDGNSLF